MIVTQTWVSQNSPSSIAAVFDFAQFFLFISLSNEQTHGVLVKDWNVDLKLPEVCPNIGNANLTLNCFISPLKRNMVTGDKGFYPGLLSPEAVRLSNRIQSNHHLTCERLDKYLAPFEVAFI